MFVCYGTAPMTNTLFLLFTRTHPPPPVRIFPVLICRGARSVTQQPNLSENHKLKIIIRRKTSQTIPRATYSWFSAISRPAFRIFFFFFNVLRSWKHDSPRSHTLQHAVELLVSSASESRSREPRLGRPSRVIPPLSLLSLLPGRMRRSRTFCTLNRLSYDHVLKSINNVSCGVTKNSGCSNTYF